MNCYWIANDLTVKSGTEGRAFERNFGPGGREFELANLQKFKCLGGCSGGDGEASASWLREFSQFHFHSLSNIRNLRLSNFISVQLCAVQVTKIWCQLQIKPATLLLDKD